MIRTNIARIGIFFPVFNHILKLNVDDYDANIEINMYILSIS